MNILLFYIKELYYKIIIFIVIITTISWLIIYKIKYIFLYILSPLKTIKISNYLMEYDIGETACHFINENHDSQFIPIIEINLPFFTTSYIYIKYIILLICYFILPILTYFIYISTAAVLKKTEYFKILFILKYFFIFLIFNSTFSHYVIIPIFIQFLYSHYKELEIYEFDVEFQILTYLDFYFFILFFNLFIFIIIETKKVLNIPKINIVLLILPFFILPNDFMVQIIYFFILLIILITSNIIKYYYNNIKKYKEVGYLEKN